MSINPHMDLWRSETYESADDRRWHAFVAEAEAQLDIESLDGDQGMDGYSLDFAFYYFKSGKPVADYVASVRKERARLGKDHVQPRWRKRYFQTLAVGWALVAIYVWLKVTP